jgi:GLPGLI family protein
MFKFQGYAQIPQMISMGVIEFEKTVNTHALIRNTMNKDNEAIVIREFEKYKQTQPQFSVQSTTLQFTKEATLYKPQDEKALKLSFIFDLPMMTTNNEVFTDLRKKETISKKKVFNDNLNVKDSLKRITWKLTSETKMIAGYNCRRANGLILDSIYIVAFYTDKINVSAGPESFSGLPGMILGVAIPHEHVTWFATKVTAYSSSNLIVPPPVKGKILLESEYRAILKKVLLDKPVLKDQYWKALLL